MPSMQRKLLSPVSLSFVQSNANVSFGRLLVYLLTDSIGNKPFMRAFILSKEIITNGKEQYDLYI